MRRSERIGELMDSGLNCAEAMVLTFADDVGLPREIAVRVATPFGGGLSRTNDICGLVSGAAIVIGAGNERGELSNAEGKERAYTVTAGLIRAITELKGSIDCTGILGADLSDPEARRRANQDPSHGKRCRLAAAQIVELLEERLGLPAADD